MFAKVVIFCVVLAVASASLVGPVGYGWGAPALAAGPWGLAGKGLVGPYAAAPLTVGNAAVAGNGILSSGWATGNGVVAPLGVGKGLVGAPLLGLGLGKVW